MSDAPDAKRFHLNNRRATHIICEAFRAGATNMIVDTGEDQDPLYEGHDQAEALIAAWTVEHPCLRFYRKGNPLGWFLLSWDADEDMMTDCSQNDWTDRIFMNTTATFGLI